MKGSSTRPPLASAPGMQGARPPAPPCIQNRTQKLAAVREPCLPSVRRSAPRQSPSRGGVHPAAPGARTTSAADAAHVRVRARPSERVRDVAAEPAEQSALPSPRGRNVDWLSVCATSTSTPACVKHRRAPRPVEARRLCRGRPHKADRQHSSPSCLITTVKWLSRELSSYPIRHARPVERFGIRGTIPLSRDASL